MQQPVRVLALFAHPDDAEFLCAGTLALLAARGAEITIATMSAGDCGSVKLSPAKISSIRQGEAAQAARQIGARYACLGGKDLSIFYDRTTLSGVVELVRRRRPQVSFTHSPADYMADHETTSQLCQTACFGAMAPNYRTGRRPAAKPLCEVPYLYYADPFGRKDILGQRIPSAIYVDIAETLKHKKAMLACHRSQRAWLATQQQVSDPESLMLKMAEEAGQCAGVRWAEGFRQHLGQGFPQDNLLARLLSAQVHR